MSILSPINSETDLLPKSQDEGSLVIDGVCVSVRDLEGFWLQCWVAGGSIEHQVVLMMVWPKFEAICLRGYYSLC